MINDLNNLHLLLDSLDIRQNKKITLDGDLNLFPDTAFEAEWRFPLFKKDVCSKIEAIDDDVEILYKIESVSKTLCKSQSSKNVSQIEKRLCAITTPSLNINLCEKDLSETDLYNAMKNIHNKSPENDELTK